jgi:hypothetical protein
MATKSSHYLVRFHLGRGKHYRHIQVKSSDGTVEFINPEFNSLILKDCKLCNQKGVAQKIFDGANKRPCAWVKCRTIKVIPYKIYPKSTKEVAYNPRKTPYWINIIDGKVIDQSIDGSIIQRIATSGTTFWEG